jgi:hypothetical protein
MPCAMKRNLLSRLLLIAALMPLLTACLKDYEPVVEGIWDQVNVVNINATVEREWHFVANELKIYRYNVNTPDNLILEHSGRYIVRNTAIGLYLRIAEMNYSTYNDDWEILKLKNGLMVLSLEVPGGVIYKELTKRGDN